MENVKIEKANGKVIPCLVEVPEGAKRIVIMVHGFTSCKDCPTAELLFRRLPKVGIGVVTYDQPGHGEATDDPLGVFNCIDSLETVENYVAERFPGVELGYFGSSYGAYVTCMYISTRAHRGNKAFLRSAAVNMPDLILEPLKQAWSPEVEGMLKAQGYIAPDIGLGDVVQITTQYIKELSENNLFEKFDNEKFGHVDLEFVHGSNDPVVNINAASSFAEKFGFKFNVIEGEGHSICDKAESPDKVADLAIAFYG